MNYTQNIPLIIHIISKIGTEIIFLVVFLVKKTLDIWGTQKVF